MPASVDTAFTVRQPAWWDTNGDHDHVRYPASIEEAREWAGHNWEPEEAPAFQRIDVADPATFAYEDGDEVVALASGAQAVYRRLAGEKRIVRSDNRQHIATLGDTFEVIGIKEMYEVIAAVCDEENIQYETGGVLENSRKVWALARLNEPWQAPGDPSQTYPYVAFLNAFDKSASAKTVNTTVRVVCANTFGMADTEGRATGREFTFRHTKNVHQRIADAKQALQGLRADTLAWQELATRLALTPVTPAQRELFLAKFIPAPPETLISDRVLRNVEDARNVVAGYLASPTCEGISESAYGLVQAAAEYLDHGRAYRTTETHLKRTLLRSEPLKGTAVKLVRDILAETGGQLAGSTR